MRTRPTLGVQHVTYARRVNYHRRRIHAKIVVAYCTCDWTLWNAPVGVWKHISCFIANGILTRHTSIILESTAKILRPKFAISTGILRGRRCRAALTSVRQVLPGICIEHSGCGGFVLLQFIPGKPIGLPYLYCSCPGQLI